MRASAAGWGIIGGSGEIDGEANGEVCTLSCIAKPVINGLRGLAAKVEGVCAGLIVGDVVVTSFIGEETTVNASLYIVAESFEEAKICYEAVKSLADNVAVKPCGEKSFCILVEGGAASEVTEALRAAGFRVPRLTASSISIFRAEVDISEGDAYVEIGKCGERLDMMLEDIAQGKLWSLLRGFLAFLDELGLTTRQLFNGIYDVDSELITHPIHTYTKSVCLKVELPWNLVEKGKADVPRPSVLKRRLARLERSKAEAEEVLRSFINLVRGLREEAGEKDYWDNGFTVKAVDPFPHLRVLCTSEIMETLERLGIRVEKILDSEGIHRESHHVIVTNEGDLIEVNCSGLLDEHNWVKVHSKSREKTWTLIKEILRDHYRRMEEEAHSDVARAAYRALLRVLDRATSLDEIVAAVKSITEHRE